MLKHKFEARFDGKSGARCTIELVSISRRTCRKDVLAKYPDAKRIEIKCLGRTQIGDM